MRNRKPFKTVACYPHNTTVRELSALLEGGVGEDVPKHRPNTARVKVYANSSKPLDILSVYYDEEDNILAIDVGDDDAL